MTEIQFDPEYQKGGQRGRYSHGVSKMAGLEHIHKHMTRVQKTPNEIAAWKLNQALEKYPIFTEESRQQLQNEFVNMPNLKTINVKTFAAALAFLSSIFNLSYI